MEHFLHTRHYMVDLGDISMQVADGPNDGLFNRVPGLPTQLADAGAIESKDLRGPAQENSFSRREIVEPHTCKPSRRNELEITDVNNAYVREGTMTYSFLDGWRTDAGTFDSLLRAANRRPQCRTCRCRSRHSSISDAQASLQCRRCGRLRIRRRRSAPHPELFQESARGLSPGTRRRRRRHGCSSR